MINMTNPDLIILLTDVSFDKQMHTLNITRSTSLPEFSTSHRQIEGHSYGYIGYSLDISPLGIPPDQLNVKQLT